MNTDGRCRLNESDSKAEKDNLIDYRLMFAILSPHDDAHDAMW